MTLRSTIHFALIGPFIGTVFVFVFSSYIFQQPQGNYNSFKGGFGSWLLFGYIFGVIPAALTGLVNGIANNSVTLRKRRKFSYTCAFINGVTGLLFSILFVIMLIGDAGGKGFFVWGFSGGASGVLCSLLFNGNGRIRDS